MILKAAIKIGDGSVFTGKRHNDCTDKIREQYPIFDYPDIFHNHVMGFVTHIGEFVNREEAAIIAKKYKQIIPVCIDPLMWEEDTKILFSEDLY